MTTDIADGAAATREGAQPAEDAKPADGTKPAEGVKPAEGAKPAEGTKPAEGADGAKPAAKPAEGTEGDGKTPTSQVPDKYDLKVPENRQAFVDPEDLRFLEGVARKSNWSQTDAQAALDEHLATLTAQEQRFKAQTLADPDYGGDHFADTERLGRAAIDKLRPVGHPRRESFLRFLNRGGAGSHIEVVSFFADLGKAMSEDTPTHARSTPQSGTRAGTAATLYDNPASVAIDKAVGG
jgi:hypothetical protein